MTMQDTSIIDAIKRWIILFKKINKALNRYSIPKDLESMKKMKAELENEEQIRNDENRTREAIKHLIRKKKQRERWIKLERRRKIRKFLRLPYKTLNEDDFFKDTEESQGF